MNEIVAGGNGAATDLNQIGVQKLMTQALGAFQFEKQFKYAFAISHECRDLRELDENRLLVTPGRANA
jgi:hypothetical protein